MIALLTDRVGRTAQARCAGYLRAGASALLGVHRIRAPPAIADRVVKARPQEKLPVRVCRYPNRYGPAKPAMLPRALIIPTAAAAADVLRISVGIAQNVGRYAAAMHAILKNTTESPIERG